MPQTTEGKNDGLVTRSIRIILSVAFLAFVVFSVWTSPKFVPFIGPRAPAVVGQPGYLIGNTIGCPDQSALIQSFKQFVQSEKVNDVVGVNDVINQALEKGCRSIIEGATGLVIGRTGYLSGWTEIRLDDDQTAYWMDDRYVGTTLRNSWDIEDWLWRKYLVFRPGYSSNPH